MTEAVGGECALSPSRQTEAHIYVAASGGLSSFLQLMSADAGCVRQDREEDRASSALQEEKVDIRNEGEGGGGGRNGRQIQSCTFQRNGWNFHECYSTESIIYVIWYMP